MKFNFKIQSYQTDAVNSIVSVFAGQPKYDDSSENTLYARDIGKKNKNASKKEITELQLHFKEMGMEIDQYDAEEQINSAGYRNADIVLSDDLLLDNIKNCPSTTKYSPIIYIIKRFRTVFIGRRNGNWYR